MDNISQRTKNPEYAAFIRCYVSLVDTIAQECGTFCNSLFAKSYILSELRDFTRLDKITNKRKAQQLVDALADQIKHHPGMFHGFLEILKTQMPFTDDLLKQLESCYETETKNTSNNHSQSMQVDKVQTLKDHLFAFVCPYCSECTLEEFVSRRNCVEASEKTLFPYLDTPSLSFRERRILEARLHSDTEKIITLFAEIDTRIASNLQASIPVLKNFILILVSPLGHEKHIEQLEKAETIPEIFVALHPFKSFLNYRIVEKIVNQFGSKENRKDMQTYSDAFTDFCKRSAFNVPLNVLSQYSDPSKTRVLSIKLVSKGEASLKDVVSSQQKIATILGVNDWDLHIASMEKGCVCLRYLMSEKRADYIFPLSQAQMNALDTINVIATSITESDVVASQFSPTQVSKPEESAVDRKTPQQLGLLSLPELAEVCNEQGTQYFLSSVNTSLSSEVPQICVFPAAPLETVPTLFDSSSSSSSISQSEHLSVTRPRTSSGSSWSSGYNSMTTPESPTCTSASTDFHF